MAELMYNAPILGRLGWRMKRRPDLMYERYAVGNFAATLLCRSLGIPLVLEVNDSVAIERSRPTSYRGSKLLLERRVLSAADLIVTITDRFKSQLLEAIPHLPEGKILVLPNAVSERRFQPRPAKATAALRAKLGLGRRVLVGNAGQFLPWHGLAPFVAATAALARERDLGFLFVGDGPARQEVQEVARVGGVADRVYFTGMVPHALVPDYLSLLDVAVIPSVAPHASPMKLMEFMAMELPVVAPDLPNIIGVLEDGQSGRTFRHGDMADLLDRLLGLLDNPDAARELGRRARAHVLTHLTWAGHVRVILETLSRLRPLSEASPCIS
jgi:glycosyltransferase involved in cell wall biosynthesis